MSELRERGFTHLLIDATMLDVWNRAGWLNPLLDRAAITQAADRHATLLVRYPDGTAVYRLPN
jgi:hypothetical protein